MGMSFSENSGYGSNGTWGFVIFFLVLFLVWGRNNAFAGETPAVASSNALLDTTRTTAELAFSNFNQIKDIQAQVGRNDAVLDGKLETGFRAVIDNDNKNTVEILRGQDQMYIKQLERDLCDSKQKEQTAVILLGQERSENRIQRQLDRMEGDMLTKSPQYVQSCVPCSSDPFCNCR